MPQPSTIEAQVVRFADRLAYVNHDIDDAIRAGLIAEPDLPEAATEVLGHTHGHRIETLVNDIVEATAEGPEARMSEPVLAALDQLRQFMFDRVYLRSEAAAEQEKAVGVISALVKHYLEHPDEIPEEYARAPGELADRVADYIAGMTDRYALRTYERLFLPRGGML
jgi:dGTPase